MGSNHKHLDTQRILHYLRQYPAGISIEEIIFHSGADKLRVYPALFELEQAGRLEVLEREELGAPRIVKLLSIENGQLTIDNSIQIEMSE